MKNFTPFLKEGIIYIINSMPYLLVFLLSFKTFRLMRKTMMETNKKFEMTIASEVARSTMKRRRRRKMGLLLRNHREELKCSCTPGPHFMDNAQPMDSFQAAHK